MNVRTTIRMRRELLARAKRRAADEGRTLTALIEDGVMRVLDEGRRQPKAAKKLKLPVSKATGGLQPGVDLTRFADYQEMEDLEYIERLRKGFK